MITRFPIESHLVQETLICRELPKEKHNVNCNHIGKNIMTFDLTHDSCIVFITLT